MGTAEEIAARALSIVPLAERASFLDSACGRNGALRERVDAILSAGEETRLIADAPTQMDATAAAPALAEAPGVRIGPYRLVRPVAAGGMGMVWVAEQESPIRRDVALKIIKPGMASAEIVMRFEAERQTLAVMDHPNIAKVLDAGTTAGGRPYFVMELVQGVPITEYCDANRLGPRSRMELMIPVCRAVQHAHQKGIIHRDLKPSNILVSTYDGQPAPKVIDFGIAKATGPSAAGGLTQAGGVIGTLEYMSPEQAESGGTDIDTRSDIYALGVVMYELLTGRTPLDWTGVRRATYIEALRRIRDEEAPPPSTQVAKGTDTLAETASRRGAEPAKLPSLLRGELDWIVMKALDKDRARRYETANALARDIERFLNGEPVEASPLATSYRVRKFARKHRLTLATAAAILVMLIGAVVVSSSLAIRARRAELAARQERDLVMSAESATREQRDRAMKAETEAMAQRDRAMQAQAETSLERDRAMTQMHRADTEADTARAVLAFLQRDVLGQASADNQARVDVKPDPDLKVRTALDRAAARIEGAFRDKPAVQAAIRSAIGSAYAELGVYGPAQTQLESSLQLRRGRERAGDPAVVETANMLTKVYYSEAHYDQALELAQSVYAAGRETLPADDPRMLEALNNIAAVQFATGKYGEATELLTDLYERRKRVRGADHADTLEAALNVAAALQQQGRVRDAERFALAAADGYRKAFGPAHPRTLIARRILGQIRVKLGNTAKAEADLREVARLSAEALGPDHPDTALALDQLAGVLMDERRYAEALPVYRRELDIARRVLGPDHPRTLDTLHNIGVALTRDGKTAESEPFYAELVERRRRSNPAGSAELVNELAGLGAARVAAGKYAEAEPVLREAFEARKKVDPPGYPRFNAESLLGASLAGQGRYAEAEPLLLSGYAGMKALGSSLPADGKARFQLAGERIVHLYESWGKPHKAAQWRQALGAR